MHLDLIFELSLVYLLADEVGKFELPFILEYSKFSTEIEPLYIINAV